MSGLHATFAPSAAARWMRCIGSTAAIKNAKIYDEASEYAAEGSVAHEVAKDCLRNGTDAIEYIGEVRKSDGFEFEVDDDMASFVQVYVDQIRQRPGERSIEETLDLSEVYGVENQFGTADTVIFNTDADMLEVRDLKFGRGVIVFAKNNEQALSYAAGAFKLFEDVWDWKKVLIAIHQPRVDHYDEWIIDIDELKTFMSRAEQAATAGAALLVESDDVIAKNLTAGEKQCQWCPLKGTCNTLTEFVHETAFNDFNDISEEHEIVETKDTTKMDGSTLATALERLDLILSWASEVRAEGLKRVKAGIEVPRWKQVAGKKGARKFGDNDEAEKIMKSARFKSDEMYSKKLLTAPAAEKLCKKLKKPKIWNRLAALIVQPDGAPGLAPESDPRPALITKDAFEDVTEDDFSDLL